jgi:hypothetical protein
MEFQLPSDIDTNCITTNCITTFTKNTKNDISPRTGSKPELSSRLSHSYRPSPRSRPIQLGALISVKLTNSAMILQIVLPDERNYHDLAEADTNPNIGSNLNPGFSRMVEGNDTLRVAFILEGLGSGLDFVEGSSPTQSPIKIPNPDSSPIWVADQKSLPVEKTVLMKIDNSRMNKGESKGETEGERKGEIEEENKKENLEYDKSGIVEGREQKNEGELEFSEEGVNFRFRGLWVRVLVPSYPLKRQVSGRIRVRVILRFWVRVWVFG